MIRLFVSDIDGCLAEPYRPYDLEALGQMAAWTREAGTPFSHPRLPAVSICSGRSYPYVEAMTQLLGCVTPVLFESGAGLFDPDTARSQWHPAFTPDIREGLVAIRTFMESVIEDSTMSMDHAKGTQAALVGTDVVELHGALRIIEDWVTQNAPGFTTFHTHVSIDVVPPGLSKKEGLVWLAEKTGVSLDEIAFIGDTNGDIAALESVGRSFAPANAQPQVKNVVHHICSGTDIQGVIEAYRLCMG
jgi:hydroxymethylpyrimidine pyrophosphatase-like HAD family hydrolase